MTRYKNHSARVAPAASPLPADIQGSIDAVMRGGEPLVLFTTLARDRRLFFKLFSAGLLDRGTPDHPAARNRHRPHNRIVQCRIRVGGVHVAAYATKAELDEPQIAALVERDASEDVWSDEDRVLIRLCDSLHQFCTVDDDLWQSLTEYHSDEAIIELLMLAGYYRMISYLVNGLRLPLEPNAPRFADIHGLGQQFRWPAGE